MRNKLSRAAFNELAVFEAETESGTPDTYGNVKSGTWSKILSEWGNLRETPGRERLQAGAPEATATATLLIAYSQAAAALTAKDRVKVRGAVWGIISAPIHKPGRPPLLEFMLRRGAPI